MAVDMYIHEFRPNPACEKHVPTTPHCLECGYDLKEGNHYPLDVTVDLTPTWTALLTDMLLSIGFRIDSKSKEALYIEFKRMAEAADNWNEYTKNKNRAYSSD